MFDHAAQCFTATDPAFQQQCEAWVAAGAARRWQGPVGTLKPAGVFEPLEPSVAVYVATDGMRQLAESMAEQVSNTVFAATQQAAARLWPSGCDLARHSLLSSVSWYHPLRAS
jgi:predicted NAD/FAD-dependent oxidoreductase